MTEPEFDQEAHDFIQDLINAPTPPTAEMKPFKYAGMTFYPYEANSDDNAG